MADKYENRYITLPVPGTGHFNLSERVKLTRNAITKIKVYAGSNRYFYGCFVSYKATLLMRRDIAPFVTDEGGYAVIEVELPSTRATTARLLFTTRNGVDIRVPDETYVVACDVID